MSSTVDKGGHSQGVGHRALDLDLQHVARAADAGQPEPFRLSEQTDAFLKWAVEQA
jgi:hypothetical protein